MKMMPEMVLRPAARVLAAVLIINLLFAGPGQISAYADDTWPYPASSEIKAEGAVVIDADTLTVLWGRNKDEQFFPASITKIMTALVVLENCALEDRVTITAEAVYNLESGATTASLVPGDELSVQDLLYASLLKSANDAANALAIHVAGSISEFASMMNERARELGCLHTDFRNPTGLTDTEHLTTAYDMALILAECIKNPIFLEIESHDSYRLSGTTNYPDGLTVSMGHKMLKSGTTYSDDRVIAGKTGYITASGNTLVTAALDDESGRTVIVVVLSDSTPYHYTDTRQLMEFGFDYFDNIILEDPVSSFECEARLATDTIISGGGNHILTESDAVVTLPKDHDEGGISVNFDYNLPVSAPELACAILRFYYEDRNVGSIYLLNDKETMIEIEGVEDSGNDTRKTAGKVGITLIISVAALILLILAVIGWKAYSVKMEADRMKRLRSRRQARLESMGVSREEFDEILESRRNRRDNKGSGGPGGKGG